MSNVSSKEPKVVQTKVQPEDLAQTSVRDERHAPWGPIAAIIITVLGFLGSVLIAGVMAFNVAGVMGRGGQGANAWLSTVPGQFTFVVVAELSLIAIVAGFIRHRKGSLKHIGLGRWPQLEDIGRALLAFGLYLVALIAATVIAKQFFHIDVDQKQELGFDNVYTPLQTSMAFVSLVVLPPLAEEFLFRGFFYTGIRKRVSFVYTTLFVSAAFASLHLLESSEGLLWIAGIDTFILSLFLCYLREKTGSLWASIFCARLQEWTGIRVSLSGGDTCLGSVVYYLR